MSCRKSSRFSSRGRGSCGPWPQPRAFLQGCFGEMRQLNIPCQVARPGRPLRPCGWSRPLTVMVRPPPCSKGPFNFQINPYGALQCPCPSPCPPACCKPTCCKPKRCCPCDCLPNCCISACPCPPSICQPRWKF